MLHTSWLSSIKKVSTALRAAGKTFTKYNAASRPVCLFPSLRFSNDNIFLSYVD